MLNLQHHREDGTVVAHTWDFPMLNAFIEVMANDYAGLPRGIGIDSPYAKEAWDCLMHTGTFTFLKSHPELDVLPNDYLSAWR